MAARMERDRELQSTQVMQQWAPADPFGGIKVVGSKRKAVRQRMLQHRARLNRAHTPTGAELQTAVYAPRAAGPPIELRPNSTEFVRQTQIARGELQTSAVDTHGPLRPAEDCLWGGISVSG
jgi:hypothetical protein